MDKFTKKKRSEIMSKIRSQNTKIELFVFRELRKNGIYFQKHYKKASGSPDIAFPRRKKAVFIDGDFWHGYRFHKLQKTLPNEYWLQKISNNVIRDRKNKGELRKNGWTVLRLWEHEIEKKPQKSINKIINFLNKN
jgi:DNA mismatch endonuclease (patch repair protein)